MSIKAFIFDLDGTLLDSMAIWDTIGEKYLASKGITDIPKNMKEILKPMSLIEAAEYFIKSFGINLSAECIMQEINLMIEDKYKYEIITKAGVFEFLCKNNHVKMCIATATDKFLVELALKRLKLDQYFEFIITVTEVGSSKQTPDIFIQAAKMLDVKIEEAIVFEDALHAIKSAKSVGFYTVGVFEQAFEADKQEILQIADHYVVNLNEFEVIL